MFDFITYALLKKVAATGISNITPNGNNLVFQMADGQEITVPLNFIDDTSVDPATTWSSQKILSSFSSHVSTTNTTLTDAISATPIDVETTTTTGGEITIQFNSHPIMSVEVPAAGTFYWSTGEFIPADGGESTYLAAHSIIAESKTNTIKTQGGTSVINYYKLGYELINGGNSGGI